MTVSSHLLPGPRGTATRGTGTRGEGTPGQRPATPIARDMSTMIYRIVAGYSVVGLAPGLSQLLSQSPGIRPAWLLLFCVAQGLVVLGMLVQAARRRSIRTGAGAFAVLTLVAVLTFPTAAPPVLVGPQPFLWWQIGLAVVCAGVWGGVRASVGYGLVLAAAWTYVRLTPPGGAAGLTIAGAEGLFGAVAGVVIAVVVRGMLDSARSADAQAAQVYAVELQQAIERAVDDERARLDQLIHDDVMTTLTAAAQSSDAATGRATALLAHETLAVVDELQGSPTGGSISVSVLASLAEQTVRRVSPEVGWVDRVAGPAAWERVPSPMAESLLAGLREAARNAVRHARAAHVRVELQVRVLADELDLVVRVVDDGCGFDLALVPANRLGVRVSMLEATRRAGIRADLRTAPGSGTELRLAWRGPTAAPRPPVPAPPATEPRLPVDFPARQFVAASWAAVAVSIGVGIATFGRLHSAPAVLTGMLLVLVGCGLVLARGRSLTLPTPVAALVLVTQALLSVSMVVAIRSYDEPDILHWHSFPAELVMVVLVIRRRLGWALAVLFVFEAGIAWSCVTSGLGWDGLLRAGSGQVLFVAMSVLVTRVLGTISRRQAALRRQEDDAIDASVRQHVAVVQRALWVADLRAQARTILVRLSQVTGSVPDDLRREALLLEATLRESLMARNVMSDELAVLTEGARRRGIDVRLVDSRHTVVPPHVRQALLDAVRGALAAESVSRLVVRLGPEDGATAASVLTEDAEGTHLLRLDASGVREAADLGASGR